MFSIITSFIEENKKAINFINDFFHTCKIEELRGHKVIIISHYFDFSIMILSNPSWEL